MPQDVLRPSGQEKYRLFNAGRGRRPPRLVKSSRLIASPTGPKCQVVQFGRDKATPGTLAGGKAKTLETGPEGFRAGGSGH